MRGAIKETTTMAHCMRDPSVIGACAGPDTCSCECFACLPPPFVAFADECECFHAPEQHGPNGCEAVNWTAKPCSCPAKRDAR